MNEIIQADSANIDQLLNKVKQQGLDYLEQLPNRPTSSVPFPNVHNGLPEKGIGGFETLRQFNQRFEPSMVATTGPRYWGFVIGGTTPAAIAGDWLTTIYDSNSFSVTGQGDISTAIEMETIQLLLELFDLPKEFIGGFVTGATMSNFTSLAVARQWIGKQTGQDYAKDGIQNPVKVFTTTPHSSSVKCLSMLGMGSRNLFLIDAKGDNREAMDIDKLEEELMQIGNQPFILLTSAGTVNSSDFDDFNAIVELRKKYTFWWHIDAAFGGFAACSPEYKHLVDGWQHADSITIDCHKWLNVPYESAVFFIKESHKYIQTETFQNSNAPYLETSANDFGYLNFIPENSRRLKALPAWFTLHAYGKQGYMDIVENSVHRAIQLASYIKKSSQFELLAPVRLNTVCFAIKNGQQTEQFLHKLNSSGLVYMSPTIYQAKKCIRAAFVNWRTVASDVDLAFAKMAEVIETLTK